MADDLWAEEAVSATLEQLGLTAGADADLPDAVRFVRRAREMLSAASLVHGAITAPTVLLLTPSVSESLPAQASFHRRVHTGQMDPSGRVWFVGTAVRTGYSLPLPSLATDDIFDLVCGSLALGDVSAVYYDAAAQPPVLAWYPSGLAEADDVYEGPLVQSGPPTIADLLKVVDRVHKTRLMTSFNQNVDTKLWQDGSKHWAHFRAEKRVQDALMAGLGGAFGSPYFIEQEFSGDTGRFDIGFRESIATGVTKLHVILELKVTRSFGSTGTSMSFKENEQHVVEGVEQAWSYADEHGADAAACLVFDLRKEDEHRFLAAASARAVALSVLLRLWRCFPTAEDYRTFVLPDSVT